MLRALRVKRSQGKQTIVDLRSAAPRGFVGRPEIVLRACEDECRRCAEVCPTEAITLDPVRLDLGKCVFCTECVTACPAEKIRFTNAPQMASSSREALLRKTGDGAPPVEIAEAVRRIFGRSLKLRQVSAGGCNACELELNAAANVNFDFGRYGIDWVASPRHADALVLTGPLTRNMADAVELAYAGMPEPKLVVAVGACAISGGLYADSAALDRRFVDRFPPSLYVPGCPPHPLTFVLGLLDLLGVGASRTRAPAPAEDAPPPDDLYDPKTVAQGHETAARLTRALGADLGAGVPRAPSAHPKAPETERRHLTVVDDRDPRR